MKKNNFLSIILLFLLGYLQAQDGYTYTFMHNGDYSFTVQAVPNTSSNNFATSVQSYGFTIILPDGITIDTNTDTSLGGTSNETFFDGSNIAQPDIDGYLVTETLGGPISLPAPSVGTNSNMYTFTVNGSPTSGTMYILENNSTIANTVTPLKSFMQADMIDDGSVLFANVVDPNGSAVSGMSSFNFATLSVSEIKEETLDVSLYPNPSSDIVKISVPSDLKDIQIEVFDNSGKQINLKLLSNNTFNVSNLSSGIYLVNIISDKLKTTKKLIVK